MVVFPFLQAREEGHTGYVEGGVVEYSRWIVCAQRSGKRGPHKRVRLVSRASKSLFLLASQGTMDRIFPGANTCGFVVSGLEVFQGWLSSNVSSPRERRGGRGNRAQANAGAGTGTTVDSTGSHGLQRCSLASCFNHH
jgi:hypothetical protein